MSPNARPTCVDLFCGAGGSSLGVLSAGFDIRAAVDHDAEALQTHRENLPCPVLNHDLTDVDVSTLPCDVETVDYVHGSPPCKGFSTASGDRDPDDERNNLVFSFIEWVAAIDPQVVTMENVTGIRNITDEFIDEVSAAFNNAGRGYEVRWKTLNAANHGVPQKRKRVFAVAVRQDRADSLPTNVDWFPTPEYTSSIATTETDRPPWHTIRDAIGDLLFEDESAPTAEYRTIGEDEVAADTRPMCNHDASPLDVPANAPLLMTDQINESHQLGGRRPIHSIDKPANTVRAGTPSALIHWDGETDREDGESVKRDFDTDPRVRRLTVRECARLQSFPDWYAFVGTKTSQTHQIGNAVPPLLQKRISKHVREALFETSDAGASQATTVTS